MSERLNETKPYVDGFSAIAPRGLGVQADGEAMEPGGLGG